MHPDKEDEDRSEKGMCIFVNFKVLVSNSSDGGDGDNKEQDC